MTGTILQANKGLDEAITAKDFFFSMMRIHKLRRHLRFEATIPNFLEEHLPSVEVFKRASQV